MKPNSLSSLLFLALAVLLLSTCQKTARDNPWDTEAGFNRQATVPVDLSLKHNTITKKELSWQYVGDERIEGFRIDRKQGDEDWWVGIASLPKETRQWEDVLILPVDDLVYTYRICSYAGNFTSDFKTISFTSQSIPQPQSFEVLRESEKKMKLIWNFDHVGEEGFIIDRKIGSEGWKTNIDTVPAFNYSYTDTNLFLTDKNLFVEYAVYGYYKSTTGKKSFSYGSVFLEQPTNLTFTLIEGTSLRLEWLDNSLNEVGYKIDRKKDDEQWVVSYATLNENTTNFIDTQSDLNAGTYTYRVYAFTRELESGKTEVKIGKPIVSTANPNNLTNNSVTTGGNITDDNGQVILSRGVCWSTNQNPTTSNSRTFNGTGTGSFTSQITGLNSSTVYYVRAYATNSAGTSYGNQVQFTTSAGTMPSVLTNSISNISTTYATGGGDVSAQGSSSVTARGVCWSTNQSPTTSNGSTSDGTGTGSFTSLITGLNPATVYYVRAYATNSAGTNYGNQVQFTTSAGSLPTVLTTSITNISTTSGTGGGNVTAQGSSSVTARGVCWSTNQSPTTSNSSTNNGSGTGSFTSQITGLNPATVYYVRAYATNSAGTSYGNQVQFTTTANNLPSVVTTSISNISNTSATGGGNITDQGSSSVTARGVCWSTNQSPTTSNSSTNNGTGTGSFTSLITGLNPATVYYVRAYATNAAGTAYGWQITFTTLGSTVVVEVTNPATGKTWMDRNLGASRVAQSSSDVQAYGDLYQWGRGTDGHEKRTSGTTSTLSNSDTPGHGHFILSNNLPYDWRNPQNNNLWQGVNGTNNPCPPGFRLPTDAEWEAERQSWSSSNANGAFNSPLRLPVAGYRHGDNGSLNGVGSGGNYWSNTFNGANARGLGFNSSSAGVNSLYRVFGFSVRCIKD